MRRKGVFAFLKCITPLETLLNAVTSVINHDLYSTGLAAIQRILSANPSIAWNSVWSGFALIVNRETPYHRDSGGSITMHDLLFSAGTHQDCYIEVAELGAEFLYLPGTAVALCGKALRHWVKSWAGGERIAVAHFMKDAVHNRLGLERPGWPLLDHYLAL